MSVNPRALIQKLNATCRTSLEAAAGLCLSRSNYEVDIEHLLLKLLEVTNSDLIRISKQFEIEPARLIRDVNKSIDRMRTGNSRTPALSHRIVRLLTESWTLASLEFNSPQLRSGILLAGLLSHEDLSRLAKEISPEFAKIAVEALRQNLIAITAGSVEDVISAADGIASSLPESGSPSAAGSADESPSASAVSKTPSLDQYTVNLTAQAKAGKIDSVLGRDFEIRQMIDILTRRRQNNPILTGEAGVGKTAVVEGFALRVAAGDVPPALRQVQIRTLDLGLLQAGAGVKGEFENRLKSVINEVKASPIPIILFIDEAHTMIGAGGQAGQNDAANLLKPALARGELRTIAATTWSEYKKYFEKDAALARRFQVVKVDEPDEARAIAMMRGLAAAMEKHHKVRILDEAVEAAVRLSSRYITGRQLPDKSVSVLDTSCARVAISQSSTPGTVEDLRRQIQGFETEIGILDRENAIGNQHEERLADIAIRKAALASELLAYESRLEREKFLVDKVLDLRGQIEEGAAAKKTDLQPLRDELNAITLELTELQGEHPLLKPFVDQQTVAEVISAWTGIPAGKMVRNQIQTVLNLKNTLEERVIGQPHALEAIAQRIRTSRAGLDDPRRPIGVFLLVGTSGVGKTETALALADILYGGERNIIAINMSEYKEAHTVASLKGSPPGYVGYGDGGVLTEPVRRKPYSVVLLDEFEKSHPDVRELFYQVFDKGYMEDSEGREIDFRNTVILLTSNAASDQIMKLCADPETAPLPDALAEAIGPELRKIFKPALLGRMLVVPYYPIGDSIMRRIIELKLGHVRHRFADTHRIPFTWSDEVVDAIAARCREVETGARNVDQILTGTLLPEVSRELLTRMADGVTLKSVHVRTGPNGFEYDMA